MPRKVEGLVVDWDKEPTVLKIPRAGRILGIGTVKAYEEFLRGRYKHLVESFGPHSNVVPRERLRRFLEG